MTLAIGRKKPLGCKAYGGIPHLPGSRRGPGDKGLSDQQARILTEEVRDKQDRVIVQEKLDGSCVAVAKLGGNCVALGRAGYLARSSPYPMHPLFADWVDENYGRFDTMLREGERAVGEWLAQAHGTIYELQHEPFVLFDIITGNATHRGVVRRAVRDEVRARGEMVEFVSPHTLFDSNEALSIIEALYRLGEYGHHGAKESAEGCVWRVERQGRVDFLGKYVRPGKVDGKYLNGEPIWLWKPGTESER
jgi:hypothetical protein